MANLLNAIEGSSKLFVNNVTKVSMKLSRIEKTNGLICGFPRQLLCNGKRIRSQGLVEFDQP
jgi:hypothetical protein